jgi:alkyl sulfatase BDS1-like metallo-beta-lactamase superfamily hydrolase
MTTSQSDDTVLPGQARAANGAIAAESLVTHSAMFEPRRWTVAERVHCLVGWGLANSTVVEAPDGLIVVDTGECVEEADDHVNAIRGDVAASAAAVIYSHFHYVSGTTRWEQEADSDLAVWAHHRLPGNVVGSTAELGPSWVWRGMTQFGVFLPDLGPDAMPNVGIGPFMFNPAHTGRTSGYLPPTELVNSFPHETEIAGERVVFHEAPSDADDSLIIHLPDLGVAINNNVWPALFNIYPLRGEPYRDPRVLLAGLDLLRDLAPDHLINTHGTPISGADEVQRALLDYRDAIQFLWDQTARAVNRGIDPAVIPFEVTLPERLQKSPYVQQHYGLARHHVRQIHGGILGWWGNDGAELITHHPDEEARRLVDGLGGRDAVVQQLRTALADDDAPWAARLGSWLLAVDPSDTEARGGKADALRMAARSTPSANTRAFLLTEARELEGHVDRSYFHRPITTADTIASMPAAASLGALRVQLDPEAAGDRWCRLVVEIDGQPLALHLRGGVAELEDPPRGAVDLHLSLAMGAWASLLSGARTATELIDAGDATLTTGDLVELVDFLACFADSLIRPR